ncbi:MAG: hypothetical protein NZV14_14370 [Bryobacteraceae bacterium]|nr:hypothetical protein [Bryobacteraceae bacterium]MDW8379347.1 hypothetical protein [Bryobacterales bacterium]
MPTSVTPITTEVLGVPTGSDHLISQILPAISVIDVSTFRVNSPDNVFSFKGVAGTTCRLGLFACSNGSLERAAVLVLPPTGTVDRIVLGISHGFAQNAHIYRELGWTNPRSRPLLERVLLAHVVNRWGPQVLAGKTRTGLFHVIRGAPPELGPFASNGRFVCDCLEKVAELTRDAFRFDHVEAFTFSSGIFDFNSFVGAVSGCLNLEAVYNLDPAAGIACAQPRGARRRQFLTGMTTRSRPAGFEYLPLPRWRNEFSYGRIPDAFQYLHNHCIPNYALHLGLQL